MGHIELERARRAHLVPARHPVVAGLPPRRHRAEGRAEGQAAREGHLLRRQPGHLGRRGQAPRGPRRTSRPSTSKSATRSSKELELAIDRRYKELEDGGRGGRGRGRRHQEAAAATPTRRSRRSASATRWSSTSSPARGTSSRSLHSPQDHRRRDAVARAARQVRRLLRGWHRRRRDQAADRPHRLRRGGDQAPRARSTRRRRGRKPLVGPAPPEGHQAPQDRRLVQPSRRPRPPHQRPQGDDPRRRAGDPAGTAPDGAARRWPLRHVRPQRPVPPRDQPQQPPQAPARPRRARDHRQQREAHAAGGRRRAVRQRPPRPPGHRAGQPSAEVAVRHAEGQAGPVPPEPARQARRLLGPFGHRGRPDAASCTSAVCPS